MIVLRERASWQHRASGDRAAHQNKRLGQIEVIVAQGQVFVFVLGEVAVEIVYIMRRGGRGVVDKSFGGVARVGF
jgi:hypothetical protein